MKTTWKTIEISLLNFVHLWCRLQLFQRKKHNFRCFSLFMAWILKLASNYILCVCDRWKKKSFWGYKLWLLWKWCVILVWFSHMWVAQTCESVKQTTQIAFAVTTYEWDHDLYFLLPEEDPCSASSTFTQGCLFFQFRAHRLGNRNMQHQEATVTHGKEQVIQ